jgi:hypothetical protein
MYGAMTAAGYQMRWIDLVHPQPRLDGRGEHRPGPGCQLSVNHQV